MPDIRRKRRPAGEEAAMPESTSPGPTVAIVLNRDLLFGSRIRSALASLGLKLASSPLLNSCVGA